MEDFDPKLILGGIVAIADALKISHDDTTFSPGVKERLQKAQTKRLVNYVVDYAKYQGIEIFCDSCEELHEAQ